MRPALLQREQAQSPFRQSPLVAMRLQVGFVFMERLVASTNRRAARRNDDHA